MSAGTSVSRPPKRARLTLLVYATAAAVLAADQGSKLLAMGLLRPVGSIPLLGRYVSLTWATNTGGAFGLLPSATPVLAGIAAVVVVALVVLAQRLAGGRLVAVAMACLLGGALGNLIDRLRLGYVVDFIDLYFWPIFNIADIAITVGAGLLLVSVITGATQSPTTSEEEEVI